jgi:hypothetical protein
VELLWRMFANSTINQAAGRLHQHSTQKSMSSTHNQIQISVSRRFLQALLMII